MLIRQALQGEPVRRFMNPDPIVVPPSLDLLHWVEDFVYRYHHRAFPVAVERPAGGDGHDPGPESGSREPSGPSTPFGEVMTPDLRAVTIAADADAMEALEKMQRTGSSRLLVTEGDHLLGIVSLKDLLRFLSLKLELEGAENSFAPAESKHPRSAAQQQDAFLQGKGPSHN